MVLLFKKVGVFCLKKAKKQKNFFPVITIKKRPVYKHKSYYTKTSKQKIFFIPFLQPT